MAEASYDTLIVSDVHLGSEVSRAHDALDLLQSLSYRRLILLGDIFSDLNFRRLTGDHWKFLSYIRKLSNPKRKVEVVWVEGNHDVGLSNLMSHLVGIPVYERYVWEFQGRRHLAIHGHQFDRFVSRNLLISRIGQTIYYELQKLDSGNKTLSRFLDRLNTRWLRLEQKVARGALHYARLGKVDRVFCGHTHVATRVEQDGIAYYNTGSWIDALSTYVTVGEEGPRIHEYQCRAQNCRPVEERVEKSSSPTDLFEHAGLPRIVGFDSVRC